MNELYIPPKINPANGQFYPGAVPFNKGKSWDKWMDGRKRRKVLKCLELGRLMGQGKVAGWNAKPTLMIKDQKIIGSFKSANEAGRKTNICSRNIRNTCCGKRKRAGGYEWIYEHNLNAT